MYRYGSLVRLLTEEPARLSDADMARLQRGVCAGCRAPLPPFAKQTGFLGSRSSNTVCGIVTFLHGQNSPRNMCWHACSCRRQMQLQNYVLHDCAEQCCSTEPSGPLFLGYLLLSNVRD